MNHCWKISPGINVEMQTKKKKYSFSEVTENSLMLDCISFFSGKTSSHEIIMGHTFLLNQAELLFLKLCWLGFSTIE